MMQICCNQTATLILFDKKKAEPTNVGSALNFQQKTLFNSAAALLGFVTLAFALTVRFW